MDKRKGQKKEGLEKRRHKIMKEQRMEEQPEKNKGSEAEEDTVTVKD